MKTKPKGCRLFYEDIVDIMGKNPEVLFDGNLFGELLAWRLADEPELSFRESVEITIQECLYYPELAPGF